VNYKIILKRLSGWFIVCVWIVGVPHVLRLSFLGLKNAGQETICLVTTCGLDEDKEEEDEDKGEGTLAKMSKDDFDDVMTIYQSRKKTK
tara:strand:- start:467 stop:733 length:267 start_codon:yes stop_codon:yes gene_type:complete